MHSLVLRFCGVVSLLFGLWLSISGVATIRDAHASTTWPTAEGTVLYSAIEHRSGTRSVQRYRQVVYYSYSVDGKSYTSNRVGFGTGRTTLPASQAGSDYTEEEMREFLRDPRGMTERRLRTPRGYPAGKKLTVYYKPDDPKTAALEPGASIETFIPLTGGVIVAGIGLLVFLTGRQIA